ncbi:hypothetical protein I317_07830 [Kwoniella heveanensis CBS 569]|nr:hypothetical protein I317_07830 [Kwoniella heveanensis CBS 569]
MRTQVTQQSSLTRTTSNIGRDLHFSTEHLVFPDEGRDLELFNAYIEHVHPVLPVLPQARAREGFEIYSERRKRLGTAKKDHPLDGSLAVTFAIFALGERALENKGIWEAEGLGSVDQQRVIKSAEAGALWFESAFHMQHLSWTNVDHFQVQCLTLLAAYQASVNQMPQAWILASQAIRYAMDMGYHRQTVQREATPHNRQIRRMMWWTVYGLEKLLSLSLGRPSAVDDRDIDCPYPLALGEQQIVDLRPAESTEPDPVDWIEPPEGTLSGLVALTKLCRCAGKVSQLLHRRTKAREPSDCRAVDHLDLALDRWFTDDLIPAGSLNIFDVSISDFPPTFPDHDETPQENLLSATTDPMNSHNPDLNDVLRDLFYGNGIAGEAFWGVFTNVNGAQDQGGGGY